MLAKRQGDCPNCPHDIIDPRDLKYVRNVCGYWFQPADDPFRWRDRLGFARYGLAELVVFTLLFLVVAAPLVVLAIAWHWAMWIPAGLVMTLLGLALFAAWLGESERRSMQDAKFKMHN